MARKEKKYHYIYKTIDIRNDNYYIGAHSTNNLNDGYVGSGKRIRNIKSRYGKEILKLEILSFHADRKSLMIAESLIVNSNLLNDKKCMNLREGGQGGFSHENQLKNSPKGHEKLRELKKDITFFKKYCKNVGEGVKRGLKKRNKNGYWDGKKHTEESKFKMRKSKNVGTANPQYGTCWITDGESNMKIIKNKIELPDGWRYGRTIKNNGDEKSVTST